MKKLGSRFTPPFIIAGEMPIDLPEGDEPARRAAYNYFFFFALAGVSAGASSAAGSASCFGSNIASALA